MGIGTIAAMPRSQSRARATLERTKSLPWAAALQAGIVLRGRWKRLSEKDRARLVRLVRGSRGRLSNLSGKERAELGRLVGKADLKGIGRDLLALRHGRRRHKHR
jgi:hypothetical protein